MDINSAFPTYIPEIDQKILLEIDDVSLFRACNTNSYVQSICNNELFWHNRTLQRFSKLTRFRKPGVTWKAFYHRLVNDAMYIIDTITLDFSVYNNIIDAYNALWEALTKEYDQTREEILTRPRSEGETISGFIRLVYKGEVSAVDDEYLLYDNFNPTVDILEYPDLPALNVKGRSLFCYSASRSKLVYDPQFGREIDDYDNTPHNEFRGVFDHTYEVMHSFLTYVPPYTPDYPHIYDDLFYVTTMNSSDKTVKLQKFVYGYRTVTVVNKDMDEQRYIMTLMVDTAFFGRSAGFETFQQEISWLQPMPEAVEAAVEYIKQYYSEQ